MKTEREIMIKNEWNKINVEGIKLDMENWTKKLDGNETEINSVEVKLRRRAQKLKERWKQKNISYTFGCIVKDLSTEFALLFSLPMGGGYFYFLSIQCEIERTRESGHKKILRIK